ncbi:MAG: nucleotidyl transferase AbiEii/AbiGii toxin family protein [Caldilineaceae bacterium]
MSSIQPGPPQKPTHIPEHAEICLNALVAHGLGNKISLGGAFALLHYLDYRPTNDVDAWWDVAATIAEREQVIDVITDALKAQGNVRLRRWGSVVSVELLRDKRKIFSFQIAERSALLHKSEWAEWIRVQMDSFEDLIASKMVALVERGAPRDFRDIYAACQADFVTIDQCWRLWRNRQELADSDSDMAS